MKIYDWHIAPNPRRLHIYLAEKGISVELVEVGQEDLTLAPWFREKYPHAMVPMLELDDGTQIGEAMAIAQYFEDTVPQPKLMGIDAKDRAIVAMWEKRANEEGMLPTSELFRNTHPNFSERGSPARPTQSRRFPSCANAPASGWTGSSPSSTGNWPTTNSSLESAGRLPMQRPWRLSISRAGRTSRSRRNAGTFGAGTTRSAPGQARRHEQALHDVRLERLKASVAYLAGKATVTSSVRADRDQVESPKAIHIA